MSRPILNIVDERVVLTLTVQDGAAAAAAASAAAAAASEVETGLDAVATGEDRVQTGLDRIATAADRTQAELDAIATAADRVQTGLDRIATGEDRVQTGLDRTATATESAKIPSTAEYLSVSQKDLDKNILPINDSTLYNPNNWFRLFGPVGSVIKNEGSILINLTSGVSQCIQLSDSILNATAYKIRLDVSTSINQTIRVGSTFTSNVESAFEKLIALTTTQTIYEVEITSNSVNLFLGIIAANNLGGTLTINNVSVFTNGNFKNDIEDLKTLSLNIPTENYIYDDLNINVIPNFNDSKLLLPNNWVVGLGGSSWFVKNNGNIQLNFTSGSNQNIQLNSILTIGVVYNVKLLINSTGSAKLKIGSVFTSGLTSSDSQKIIDIFAGLNTYNLSFTCQTNTYFYIGISAALNTGVAMTLEEVSIPELGGFEVRLRELEEKTEDLNAFSKGHTFFTEDAFVSLSRYEKKLTKLIIGGDSLMANQLGGTPDLYEGQGNSFLMHSVNNITRRVYDLISWNKPIFRSLFSPDWTKTGTFTENKTNILSRGHTLDNYYQVSDGAIMEITIPIGAASFGIMARKSTTAGSLSVEINASPATIGLSSITLTAAFNNSFHIEEYHGLNEAVSNNVKITSVGINNVWGIFWWTGNTMVILNVALAGLTIGSQLSQLNGLITQNNPDAVLFQLPELNNLRDTLQKSEDDLKLLITLLNNYDTCFMSCHALGTNPDNILINYWDDYLDPNQRQLNDMFRSVLYKSNEPFIDVFNAFEQKVKNRGGTLENGDSGLWYTTDGQHGSDFGSLEWWNIVRFVFENKPVRYN